MIQTVLVFAYEISPIANTVIRFKIDLLAHYFLQIAHAKWIVLMVATIVPTPFVNAR